MINLIAILLCLPVKLAKKSTARYQKQLASTDNQEGTDVPTRVDYMASAFPSCGNNSFMGMSLFWAFCISLHRSALVYRDTSGGMRYVQKQFLSEHPLLLLLHHFGNINSSILDLLLTFICLTIKPLKIILSPLKGVGGFQVKIIECLFEFYLETSS
jgi:hypothetical protein